MKLSYSKNHKPPAPIIRARIQARKARDLELLVDTGFGGGVLIPFHLYEDLGLTLFEVPDKYYGILPTGIPITLHTATANIAIGKLSLKTHIHSHPLIEKQLAGRKLINKLKLLLDGPKEELEILTPRQ